MKNISLINCTLFLLVSSNVFYVPAAHAYLDPGTGSMLFSAIFGIIATLFYFIKGSYYKVVGWIFGLFGKKIVQESRYGIVFYSEGKQYWNTFKPVIEALDAKGVKLTYLTSGEDDEGLSYQSDNVETMFIGVGNKAYAMLGMLEADVCVMTTPGLDVLQIRRSKGVKHYAHLKHAPTDAGLYKLYSFDYYDSIFCSGSHQIDSIRELEKLRGTKQKQLLESGCLYLDVLADKIENHKKTNPTSTDEASPTKVLIAPTWGKNGALNRFGSKLIEPLLKSGYEVIVRPHPQSYMVEQDIIADIQEELKEYPNLSWDSKADGFDALMHTDIMVSDLSGVIFDYAFLFEKPVITIKFELDLVGTEAMDLPHELWELTMLDKIGNQIEEDKITEISRVVEELTSSNDNKINFKNLRDENIYNFRSAGKVTAEQLINIQVAE